MEPNQPPLENLEFYQMLHSHGADEYNAAVSSVYQTCKHDDPLEDYTPYNPIHQIGNFRFDITQWNEPDHPNASKNHKDWVGFSCTLEPNTFENGFYRGHGNPPENYLKPFRPGTHWNIEDRNLNQETEVFYDEVAGAMGWFNEEIIQNYEHNYKTLQPQCSCNLL